MHRDVRAPAPEIVARLADIGIDAQPPEGDFEEFLRRHLAQLEATALRLQRRARRVEEQIAVTRRCIALLPHTAKPLEQNEREKAGVAVHAAADDAGTVMLPAVSWVRAPAREGDVAPPLCARMLGEFRLFRGGEEVRNDQGAKVWRLIKFLIASGGGPVSRDVLVDTFWHDHREGAAIQSLYSAVHAARRVLDGDALTPENGSYLVCESGFYQVRAGIGIASDVAHLRALQAEARRIKRLGDRADAVASLERAASAYTAPYLTDEPYEPWAAAEREVLALRHLEILEALAELHAADGDDERAVAVQERIVAADPLRESSHRALITLYAKRGHRTRAAQQYRDLCKVLKRELGISPDDATRAAFERAIK